MSPKTGICLLCGASAVKPLLDFGMQPLANRFRAPRAAPPPRYPLALGCCRRCALVQLTRRAPYTQVRPRHAWLAYNEPERHLHELAGVIARLPGIGPQSPVTGISFKDDSLLLRLKKLGLLNTRRLNPRRELGITQKTFGMETIQASLVPGAHPPGPAGGVVIARHIVEHAHRPREFMRALAELAGPGGYIILEVPDCERSLQGGDYSVVWEEHISCFTASTLRRFCAAAGLAPLYFKSFPYTLENSLVAIGRVRDKAPAAAYAAPEKEKIIAANFARGFKNRRQRLRLFLSSCRKKNGPLVLFGSGHPCCSFLNLFGLKKYFAFAVDENPHKQGLLVPGTRLQIRKPAALAEQVIKFCLLTVNPDSEDAVTEKYKSLLDRNGEFSSIFPASPRALSAPGAGRG